MHNFKHMQRAETKGANETRVAIKTKPGRLIRLYTWSIVQNSKDAEEDSKF